MVLSHLLALRIVPAAAFMSAWFHDPQAVTMFLIAIVGGGFALYRFRFVPRERRRETLKAMQDAYGESAAERGSLLPTFPPFFLMGKEAVAKAVEASVVNRPQLRTELSSWDGLTLTAANEIRDSEVKFRSLLWVVREMAPLLGEADATEDSDRPLIKEIQLGRRLVNKLNNFAQMVELNLFPQDDVFGQLHRSIAPACKAVEPLIWTQNALGARWGLRVLRLLRRAEGFNEVISVHRVSRLTWRREDDAEIVIQDALYQSDYGRSVPTARYQTLTPWERGMLRSNALIVRLVPRYGGARLKRHVAAENDLIGRLRFAYEEGWDPLDLDGWDTTKLKTHLARHWEAKLEPVPAG